MNIQGRKVAVRVAAVAALLAGSSIIACTQTEADPMPGPPGSQGGTSVVPSGGSAGTTAGSSVGGTGGASGGSGAMGGPCDTNLECPMGQQCSMMTKMCSCPLYAPSYCAADQKCSAPVKDPDHCGDCTTKCPATSACSASTCTTEPAMIAEIAGCGSLKLVLDAGKIYALSSMTGDLASVALPAGGAATPITTGITGATAFAVDAMNAYVAAGMSITKVVLAGGAKSVVVTETTPIHDVAVEAGKLYYATGKDIKVIDATAVNGTPAGMAKAIGIDEGEPQSVAVSAGHILYSSNLAMNVESCDSTMECHMTELMPGVGHVKIGASQGGLIFGHRAVQTDGTKVYWVNNGLQGAAFKGADHAALGAPTKDGGAITAFAVTPTAVYYADADENFQKAALGDADPTWLARKLGMVSSMVLDSTNVYLGAGCKILKTGL